MSYPYKGVLFDLDGTIVDSMWIWEDIDRQILKQYGQDLPSDFQKKIEGMSFTETMTYMVERFNLPMTAHELRVVVQEMAYDYYRHKIPMKAGAMAFIKHIHALGIPMGIGTSNDRHLLEAVLEQHELHKYFASIRTSCEVAQGKPSPDIYLLVADELAVSSADCVVFEDTHAGVLAAKRAGMNCIAIYDDLSAEFTEEIKKDANLYIDSFEEYMLTL